MLFLFLEKITNLEYLDQIKNLFSFLHNIYYINIKKT
jgi:hypothetical protein